ncbi:alpha-1,6- mannosyltransferase [Ophidiomyces ophidiicola]|uniref:Alpha-1,6- mannosyltransferase n=1 Tax=Ophidiomyces ophidiicola TaxID=1387563 RepID=A0ACB8UTW7_9EURO|nr:alpha-1,6- mannosyltransferase [Ophidiomyces ophidiicola]KAI2077738.1 alpha-1,6- mannosyltransferase [Ophidiomyces ophidiicola]KAI2079418.1 alpha-1,6- mannosyltransferase [Ophidiomyces ophidiicola]KAI2096067.1 alpha-1,6- mannosyltransferase [Ophidiomyces ophidiicola]KAI2110013.1 alpha-1,6- mannosyltransferase [Ophidiomyces ophidiicola]
MARLTELLLLIPCLVFLHLFLSPYTKVEESFNIQAVHDILKYGIPSGDTSTAFRENYDHFTFPGAVPRTFVGAVVLAGVARPFIWLNAKLQSQLLVRGILGALNAVSLIAYARAVKRAFGREAGVWYTLLQASQFHVIYYASRTLPNMFAFGITTFALKCLLPDAAVDPTPSKSAVKYRLCLYFLTLAGIIFRSEIALLLATVTIYHWTQGNVNIRREVIPAGVCGVLVGLFVSVPIDSFFWQKYPLWPELSAFLYNVVSGNASNWGVHPWHFYFTSAIPRLLLNPVTYLLAIPMACLIPARRPAAASLLTPSLAYIIVYSAQPHKEWRFILYTVPPITAAAALGASYIWIHRAKSVPYRFLSVTLLLSTLATFLLSTFVLLPASIANYPGAQALNRLHKLAHNTEPVLRVYMDTLTCQTGVTHFLEKAPPEHPMVVLPGSADGRMPTLRSGTTRWIYDKTEDKNLIDSLSFWDRLDYALVENENVVQGRDNWELLEEIKGFGGLKLLKPGQEDGTEQAQSEFLKKIFPSEAVINAWEWFRQSARRHLTRGWWLEVRVVPKIKIMRRIPRVRS